MSKERQKHWEHIYETKPLEDVSWHQPIPSTSLELINYFTLPKTSKFIDVGGGDSLLADHLLDIGYSDITVLDISSKAIQRAKSRLGSRAEDVKWIVADASDFIPHEKYDLWHDRAAFHFLTEEQEIEKYVRIVEDFINPNGILIIGTFSNEGPTKCSGIDIKQYTEETLESLLNNHFEKVDCLREDHKTPSGKTQNFVFCSFRKLEEALLPSNTVS
jgi:ubiquinone/menaquinone biosynthesis C-methylase UbiE